MAGGRYAAQYEAFNGKYNLNFDIKRNFEIHNRFAAIDDFAVVASNQRRIQNAYRKTLKTALTSYLEEKTKMQKDKEYDMSDVSIVDFVKEFDKVINAICTDAAPEGEPYQYSDFAGLSEGVMMASAWNNAKPFNQSLGGIWGDRIRNGNLTLDDLERFTTSSINLLDSMVGQNMAYTDVAKTDLANVVMAKNAIAEAINKRSWTSWLNPFNWGPNTRENNRLKELEGKLAEYRGAGFPVDNVLPEACTKRMLGNALGELQRTYAKRNQQAQNTQAAVKSEEKKPVKNAKTTAAKNPIVQQKNTEPRIKLANLQEAIARHSDPEVQKKLKEEIIEVFAKDNNSATKYFASGLVSFLDSDITGAWLVFQDEIGSGKETHVKNTSISLYKFTVALKMNSSLSGMDPVDKIVAFQKTTDILLKNFYPATSDSKYDKYMNNYFVQNASLEDVEYILGKGQDVDAIMEKACKELGVEKTKVYLPELAESKNDEIKTDKVEEIDSINKEKVIE